MRIVKAFLAGATGLFIVITLFSLLIPSHVTISRVILVNNTTAAEVYKQAVNFENWKKWHPLFTIDSATIQCPLVSDSKKQECVIMHRSHTINISLLSADTNSIKFLLQPEHDHYIENEIVLTTLPALKSAQVEWRATTRLHWYPWEKFYGIFIDKLTGPGYEDALNGLKNFLETVPLPPKTNP